MIPNNRIIRFLILILGLIAYTFSGLDWNVGLAAWLAPVLLLYYSKNSKWVSLLFLYMGLAFCTAISKTAENLSGVFLIYITTGLSYGLIYSLPYVIEKLLVKKGLRFYTTLIFPSAVVATEYILSQMIGVWGNAAIAQFHNSNLIQTTSLFGVFGISFLVAWFASLLNWVIQKGIKTTRFWLGLSIYGIIVIAMMLFGFIRNNSTPEIEETVKVAAIIGETDIHQIFKDFEEEIIALSKNYDQEIPANVFSDSSDLELLIERTEEALSNGAKIVVWNEISLLVIPSQVDSIVERVMDLCIKYHAFVLIAVLEKHNGDLPKPFNNISIFISPEGEILWEYLKHFRNPLESWVINKGNGPIPFVDTEYGRIANAICADLDFSRYISQVGNEAVDILLVPAFDWEEVTPYHAHMAAFAAIQYGVNIVRANGNGISAFYNNRGNILVQSNSFLSDTKITYAQLPLIEARTLYSSIGDLFVYVWILFLLIIGALRISKGVDVT